MVQAVDPTSKIVYVDNDPIVLVHARALLTSTPEGATAYIDADLRDVGDILASAEVRHNFDVTRPVSISLLAPFPAGSTLAISTVTAHNPQAVAGAATYRARGIAAKERTDDEVKALFRGLELVDPGVVLGRAGGRCRFGRTRRAQLPI